MGKATKRKRHSFSTRTARRATTRDTVARTARLHPPRESSSTMAQDAMMQQMMEKKLYDMAKSMEDALDDELHRMNNMDQDDLENIRRKRLEAMKGDQDKRKKWLAMGHGELRDLQDEKEFFSEMKGEDMMVVHFYRNNWPCKVMDMHLDMLSKKHLETKFAKIDAEKSVPHRAPEDLDVAHAGAHLEGESAGLRR